ncbi:MAG: hypothetical protein JXA14_12260 [Anaerolineae bacterium]|nr:hypothetical protein [Anaerolineae bacterium]
MSDNSARRFLGLALVLTLLAMPARASDDLSLVRAQGGVYYVATDGKDDIPGGTSDDPWETITYALDNVPDDSLILVRPGTYAGRVRLRGTFVHGVTVRSEVPYRARLRNDGTVVTCFYGQGITLEGFDIAHSGPGAEALVVQIQDLISGSDQVSRITLRDNILHDSYNNDILKINNNATDVLVEGNMFYNQSGSDEHIDVNSVTDVVIQDNVFFNDGLGSAPNDTSSFIVIKDSNEGYDGQWGSERVVVRRNVFFNWIGSSGQGFVRAGEDAQPFYEASDVLIENNLMIGNSAQKIRSPFQLMNVYSVTVRANTVVGDMPALEFGARIFTYGAGAPTNDQIHLHNNVWADPTGTMGDTFNRGNNTTNLTFDNNLFWNAGNPFPTSSESIIEVSDDANRVVGDPLLGDQAGLVTPRWNAGSGQFADGSSTIREAFERLVTLYGTPGQGSPVIGAADPAYAPAEDILGNPRADPDIGAVEFVPSLVLHGTPGNETIYLTWEVNAGLPATATWRITAYSQTVASAFVATDPLSHTRAYTLKDLENHTWYAVTLNAMGGSTPILTDTVCVMPTDRFVYLPLVQKED